MVRNRGGFGERGQFGVRGGLPSFMKPKPEPTMNPAASPGAAARRALVLGFFTTVSDLECLELIRHWLDEARIACDVAPYAETIRSAMPGAVDARQIDPGAYQYLIVVSGPCWRQFFIDRKIRLEQFDHC